MRNHALQGIAQVTGRHASALERLTFFSDAVFAIAMTLLVIEIRLPHVEPLTDRALVDALAALLPNYIGFLVSFVVVARFWMGHHRVFAMLAQVPPRLTQLNLLMLLAIAFMPFPTAVLSDYVQLGAACVFYSLWLVVTGIANMAVVRRATADPALLHPDIDRQQIATVRRTSWIPVIVGLIAAGAALIAPVWSIVTLVVVTPVIGAVLARWPTRARP